MGKKKDKIILAVGVLIVLLTFVLRLPLLYAPFDNEYEMWLAFLGRQVVKGGGFYSTIPWSMKPPGELLTYGPLYLLAGIDNWELAVRLFALFLNSLATFVIFLLGRRLFNSAVGILAAIFWSVISSANTIRGTVAYAEGFMPFFTLLGFYLFFVSMHKKRKNLWFFLAGLSLGISLLYKQSALFDFLPLALYGLGVSILPFKTLDFKKIKTTFFTYLPFVLGFVSPLLIFIIYISLKGRFALFWEWAVLKPILYGGISRGLASFLKVIWEGSSLIWVLAFLGIISSFWRFKKEKVLLILWLAGGISTLVSSGKFWGYYFLQLLSPISILASVFLFEVIRLGKEKLPRVAYYLKGSVVLIFVFAVLLNLTQAYYRYRFAQFYSYLKGGISKEDYRFSLASGKLYKERQQASEFLKKNLTKKDKVFVWDGDPQIYVLAGIFPLYNDFIYSQQFWFPPTEGIGFTYLSFSQTIEKNRQVLIQKLRQFPPDWVVLGIDSRPIIFNLIKEFSPFFSFVFHNYKLTYNYQDIWIYKLKEGEIRWPKDLVIDPDFAKSYLAVSALNQKKVLLEPLAGEAGLVEALLPEGKVVDYLSLPVNVLFFGLDGKDFVGSATFGPSGETDLHLRIKPEEKSVGIKAITIRKDKIIWVYPANGVNMVIKMDKENDTLDLYFARSDPLSKIHEGVYELLIVYEGNSISKVKIPAKDIKIVER